MILGPAGELSNLGHRRRNSVQHRIDTQRLRRVADSFIDDSNNRPHAIDDCAEFHDEGVAADG